MKSTRTCNKCEENLPSEDFTPSVFKQPAHYTVVCRSCARSNRVKRDGGVGFLYVITNKAWPDWCKVGISVDIKSRLASYNTSSPLKDFEVIYSVSTDKHQLIEREVLAILSKEFESNSEWFKTSPLEAISAINETVGDIIG
mgnify:CR=1 FL=1